MRSVKWFLSSLVTGELNYVIISIAFYMVCSFLFKLSSVPGPVQNLIVKKLKISTLFLLKMLMAASMIFVISMAKAFIENNTIAIIAMAIIAILAIYLIKKMDSFPIDELKEIK